VLVNIGNLHRISDEPLRALDCQHQALAALERIGDEQEVAYTLLAAGETYAVLQEWTKAESAYNQAKVIFTRIGDQSGERTCTRLLDKLTSLKES
jgi:tetratricopeptide (TPR) repeat protein